MRYCVAGARVILSTIVLLVPFTSGRAQAMAFPPLVEARIPKAPTVATGQAGSYLAYELHLTNLERQPLALTRIAVMDEAPSGRTLLTLADSSLSRSVVRPGITASSADWLKIGPGLRAVIFLWVPVQSSGAPTRLKHLLTFMSGSGDSATTRELSGVPVPVMRDAIVIGPPLRGGVWFAANGPANNSGHRRALIPVEGTAAIAQRFAIDWVKVNDSSSTRSGDALKNESYFAEGVDALAVAAGTVVAVKDSIPENVPGITSRAVPITLETVGGNHVILDIGGGRYAFYAHLKPGSIRVRLGQRVRRGDVVGLVGNSGNSTEPHLHFHVSDGNSPLGSEGLPYAIESFELVGRCVSFGGSCPRTAATTRRGEVPDANILVRFPDR